MKVKLLKKLRKRFMWYYQHDNINEKYTFKFEGKWHIWDKRYDEHHRMVDDREALSYMLSFIDDLLIYVLLERNNKRLESIRKKFRDEIKKEQKDKFLNKVLK